MKSLLSTLFLCLVFISASAQEGYLQISSGGGVTGSADVYKIQNDGVVLKGKGIVEIKFDQSSKLRKGAAKKFLRKTKALLKDYPEFNHPGNIYTSIAVVENGTERKITWGDNANPVPKNAAKLYRKIDACVKSLTFKQ